MPTLKDLKLDRAKLNEDMKAILKKADDEKREVTKEEDAQWNTMDADFSKLHKEIERREKIEEREHFLAEPTRVPRAAVNTPAAEVDPMTTEERKRKESDAFRQWVRFGFDGLNVEQRSIMGNRRNSVESRDLPAELRAQSVGTTTAGGFLVPQGFSEALERKLKAFGGLRTPGIGARILSTPAGNDIPWPVVDDTANVGELLGENVAAAAQDVAFTSVTLKAWKYSSKAVLVSLELLQDSFFDIDDLLSSLLAERIGRITNTHFTTGDNSSKPKGVVVEAGSGKVGATGQTLSVLYDDLIDLEHSIDPAYRTSCAFMMNDSSFKVVRKLRDLSGGANTGQYLFQPSTMAGQPSTISGYPFIINQDVAVMAANAKSILFGNFQKYIIRDVMQITLLRLAERYAEFGQVGFLAFSRHDARAINADAIKYYANSAT